MNPDILTVNQCIDQALSYIDQNLMNLALDMLCLALYKDPTCYTAKLHRCRVYRSLKLYNEAMIDADDVINAMPKNYVTYFYKGNIFSDIKDYTNAVALYSQAIRVNPKAAEVLSNRALSHIELNQVNHAINDFKSALKIVNHPEIRHNYARLLWQLNQYSKGIEQCKQALALSKKPEFLLTLSLLQLTIGNFKEGWKNYESRIHSDVWKQNLKPWTDNSWIGKLSITDKRVLIYHEQGSGDFFQFIRYIKILKSNCKSIILLIPSSMNELLKNFDNDITMITNGNQIPEFDVACPIMSLPFLFKTTASTIPTLIPYIKPSEYEDLIDCTKINIGIVWSGSTTHEFDRYRTIPIDMLQSVFDLPIQYHSLQPNITQLEEEFLKHNNILNYQHKLTDYSKTSALINKMDLIISVDTSVAHLAGAMGKPVWILIPFSPDFRWLTTGKSCAWYPTATLFRQKQRLNWKPVITDLVESLKLKFTIDKIL